jgi:hypothetical protein
LGFFHEINSSFIGITAHISVQSDSWLGHQGGKTKNTKRAVTPEVMAGKAPNFNHRYI